MTISASELKALSQLAYLSPNPKEQEALAQEITAIMDFVAHLNKTKATTTPLFHPMDMQQPLRPDVVTEGDCVQALADMAPLFEDGHFLVPKVIDAGK